MMVFLLECLVFLLRHAIILSNRLSSFPIALPRVGVTGLGKITTLVSSLFPLSKEEK